jgi:hypothetical protein
MNSDSYLSVAVALLCVLALGVSATTLESSLSTDPDDVIDLDWEKLPVSQEDAAEVQSEMQGGGESTPDGDGGEEGDSDDSSSSDSASSDASSDGGETASSQGAETETRQAKKEKQRDQFQEVEALSERVVPYQPTLWERLLDLLRGLLPWLIALASLAAVGALLYRYRDRLLAVATATLPRSTAGDDADESDDWFAVEPTNEVDRLWLAMARRVDVDDPETTTAAEFADEAVKTGLNPDGVHELTGVFEEIRYGDTPVTEDRKRRARDGFRKIGLDDEARPLDDHGRPSRTDGGESK